MKICFVAPQDSDTLKKITEIFEHDAEVEVVVLGKEFFSNMLNDYLLKSKTAMSEEMYKKILDDPEQKKIAINLALSFKKIAGGNWITYQLLQRKSKLKDENLRDSLEGLKAFGHAITQVIGGRMKYKFILNEEDEEYFLKMKIHEAENEAAKYNKLANEFRKMLPKAKDKVVVSNEETVTEEEFVNEENDVPDEVTIITGAPLGDKIDSVLRATNPIIKKLWS